MKDISEKFGCAKKKLDEAALLILEVRRAIDKENYALREIIIDLSYIRNSMSEFSREYFSVKNLVSGKEDRE